MEPHGGSPDWRARFQQLDALAPDSSDNEKRRRGRHFERVLRGMFDDANMAPRSSFRPAGEEIDGSFMFRGRPMLFEAKWTKESIPASTLYQFRGKLDGKLVGTLGVFVSMGGYTEDAVDALVAGKSINLILFDGEDMRKLVQLQGIGIEAAIDFKLRAAAEKGTPYIPLPDISESTPATSRTALIVVEGAYDVQVLQTLIQTRSTEQSSTIEQPSTIKAAGGRLNLPLVALGLLSATSSAKKLVIVADGDGRAQEVKQDIDNSIADAALPSHIEVKVIVLDPNLESVIGLVDASKLTRPSIHALPDLLRGVDLRKIAAENDDLAWLLRTLGLLDGNDA